jgi:hypothetical protein
MKRSTLMMLASMIVGLSSAVDLHGYLSSPSIQAQFQGSLAHDPVVSDIRSGLVDFVSSASVVSSGVLSTSDDVAWSSLAEKVVQETGAKLLDCREDLSTLVLETLRCLHDGSAHYALQTCKAEHEGNTANVQVTAGTLPQSQAVDQWCDDLDNLVIRSSKGLLDPHNIHVAETAWKNVTTWVAMDLLKYAAAHKLARDQAPKAAPINMIAMDGPAAPAPGGGFDILGALNPLTSAVNSITSMWTGIVAAFKTTSEKSLTQMNNLAFTQWAQKAQVLKAVGIPQQYQVEFSQSLMSDYSLPTNLTSFVLSLKYAQQTTWESADALYSPSSDSHYRVKSVYKNGDYKSSMASFFVVDLQYDFKFAPDILDIKTHKSILGGIFDKSDEKYQRLPHNITVDDLNKLTAYFQLVQAQALADTLRDVFGLSGGEPTTTTNQ